MAVMTVAIVEDVPEMRELLRLAFADTSDFKILHASGSAPEFRKALLFHRPELVLLDEVLPGESGLDLVPELVEAGMKVILMTGMDAETAKKREIPAGVLGRVVKPSDRSLDRFPDVVRKLLGRKLLGVF